MPSSARLIGGHDGNTSNAAQDVTVYLLPLTGADIAVGDWVAIHPTDTANPGGIVGDSFRIADADDTGSDYGTCGVMLQAVAQVSGATPAGRYAIRVKGLALANVNSGGGAPVIGSDLTIGATAGRAIAFAGTDPQLRIIGQCQSTPASNLAYVNLNPHPRFAG